MRKKLSIICSLVLGICLLFAVGCTGNEEKTNYEYSLSKTAISLNVGETETLTVTVTPEKQFTAAFESSDGAVATVDDGGKVTAVGVGSATITVTVDGKTLTCAVTVTEPQVIEYEYALSATEMTMEVNEENTLTVTVTPEKQFTAAFESSDGAVATVDDGGKVTAVGVGSATITVTVDGKTLTCAITVTEPQIIEYEYALSATEMTMEVTEEKTLTVTVTPEKQFTAAFESSDSAVATVDDSGKVTAVGVGSAIITVTVDGKTLTATVTVAPAVVFTEEMTIKTNQEKSLGVSFMPEGYVPETLTYRSADESIASVSTDGVVKGLKVGTTTITVTVNGKEYSAIVNVEQGYTYSISETSVRIGYGKTHVLTVSVDPEKEIEEGNLVFTSENPAIASVGACNGLVEGKGAGKTIITAMVDGVELKCEVEVYNIYSYAISAAETNLFVGDRFTLEVTSDPVGEFTAVWATGNSDIVTVDNGVLTAQGAGTTAVTATIAGAAEDGNDVVLTCNVTVTAPIKAASSLTDSADAAFYNLTAVSGYKVLDWYYVCGVEKFDNRMNIPAENQLFTLDIKRDAFWDYKMTMVYFDGNSPDSANGFTRGGACGARGNAQHIIDVKLTADMSEIRVFTGAWEKTNTTELYYGDKVLASQTFSAGGSSTCAYVTFKLDTSAMTIDGTQSVRIVITPSEGKDNGNASLVAVQALAKDETMTASDAQVKVIKNGIASESTVNISEIGTVDWMLQGAQKANAAAISDKLEIGRVPADSNYNATFAYTDAAGENTAGTYRAQKHSDEYGLMTATVDSDETVHLFAHGFDANAWLAIADENGFVIYNAQIASGAGNIDNMMDITFTKAGTYKFAVHNMGNGKVGVAGMAIEKTVVYADKLEATASQTDCSEISTYNLSHVQGYDVLDWYRVGADQADDDRKDLAEENKLITSVTAPRQGFWDYKIKVLWADGVKGGGSTVFGTCGVNGDKEDLIDIKLTAGMTEIRVLTGAYQAKNTTELLYNGEVIATTDFEAGGSSACKYVVFKFDASKLNFDLNQKVQVRITAENKSGGNSSIVGIQALSLNSGALITDYSKLTFNKTQLNSGDNIDLTALGTVDWMAFKTHKNGGTAIDRDYLNRGRDKGEAHDYMANLNYSDAEGETASGTSRSFFYSAEFVQIKATLKENEVAHLFAVGWSCRYSVVVFDENGQLVIFSEAGGIDNRNDAMQIDIAPGRAGTYKFTIFKTSGGNASIAALAIGSK